MRRIVLCVAAAMLSAAAAHAAIPTSRARVLLLECATPQALRERLAAYADSAEASDPYGAGEAHWLIATSHERGGDSDRAAFHYRRALALRGAREEMLALADVLLRRRGPNDVDSVRAMLGGELAASEMESPAIATALRARLAWATFLAGDTDSAAALFAPIERRLASGLEWRYRMGRVAHALGDRRKAVDLLLRVAVASRGADEDAMKLLTEAGEPLGARLEGEIQRGIVERDRAERTVLDALGARRIRFAAPDGFPLAGALLESKASGRRPVAVVLLAPGDTLASVDTLAVTLRDAGLHVLLMDVRGSGWAVHPTCPIPEAWSGREQAMHTRVARDVREAVRAVAMVASADTSRVLVAGSGAVASIAVEAAALDARVRALVLPAPTPALVERGPMAARLAAFRRPVFFQLGPEDFVASDEITEGLYARSGAPAASRVSQSTMPGHGAEVLRLDVAARERLRTWLAESLGSSATPRTARRRG
jgi:dienelactone hydrolase